MCGGQRWYLLAVVFMLSAAIPLAAQALMLLEANESEGSADGLSRASQCYDDSSYDSFISRYRDHALGNVPGDTAPVELVITSMQGDDLPARPRCFGLTWKGIKVTTTGTSSTYFFGESAGASAPRNLSAESFARVQQFLEKLPDDGHRLPPPGHRVTVRAVSGGAISIRVYDRATLPDEIIELIRLADSRIAISMPAFQPSRQWKAGELQTGASTSPVINASDIDPDAMSSPYRLVAESSNGRLLAVSNLFIKATCCVSTTRPLISRSSSWFFVPLIAPHTWASIRMAVVSCWKRMLRRFARMKPIRGSR